MKHCQNDARRLAEMVDHVTLLASRLHKTLKAFQLNEASNLAFQVTLDLASLRDNTVPNLIHQIRQDTEAVSQQCVICREQPDNGITKITT